MYKEVGGGWGGGGREEEGRWKREGRSTIVSTFRELQPHWASPLVPREGKYVKQSYGTTATFIEVSSISEEVRQHHVRLTILLNQQTNLLPNVWQSMGVWWSYSSGCFCETKTM